MRGDIEHNLKKTRHCHTQLEENKTLSHTTSRKQDIVTHNLKKTRHCHTQRFNAGYLRANNYVMIGLANSTVSMQAIYGYTTDNRLGYTSFHAAATTEHGRLSCDMRGDIDHCVICMETFTTVSMQAI